MMDKIEARSSLRFLGERLENTVTKSLLPWIYNFRSHPFSFFLENVSYSSSLTQKRSNFLHRLLFLGHIARNPCPTAYHQ